MAYLIKVTGVPYDIKNGTFKMRSERFENMVYVYKPKPWDKLQLLEAAEAARIGTKVTVEHDAVGTYARPTWANNRIEEWIMAESKYIKVRRIE